MHVCLSQKGFFASDFREAKVITRNEIEKTELDMQTFERLCIKYLKQNVAETDF